MVSDDWTLESVAEQIERQTAEIWAGFFDEFEWPTFLDVEPEPITTNLEEQSNDRHSRL